MPLRTASRPSSASYIASTSDVDSGACTFCTKASRRRALVSTVEPPARIASSHPSGDWRTAGILADPEREDGDVVVGTAADDPAEQLVAQRVRAQPAAPGQLVGEPRDPLVDATAPVLDDPVGVEDDGVAGMQHGLV